jgi:hypothetical protein
MGLAIRDKLYHTIRHIQQFSRDIALPQGRQALAGDNIARGMNSSANSWRTCYLELESDFDDVEGGDDET